MKIDFLLCRVGDIGKLKDLVSDSDTNEENNNIEKRKEKHLGSLSISN